MGGKGIPEGASGFCQIRWLAGLERRHPEETTPWVVAARAGRGCEWALRMIEQVEA